MKEFWYGAGESDPGLRFQSRTQTSSCNAEREGAKNLAKSLDNYECLKYGARVLQAGSHSVTDSHLHPGAEDDQSQFQGTFLRRLFFAAQTGTRFTITSCLSAVRKDKRRGTEDCRNHSAFNEDVGRLRTRWLRRSVV